MTLLLQNIKFTTSDIITKDVKSIQDITFSVHENTCNYISAPGFEGYVFNFSKVKTTEILTTGVNHGLIINNNKIFNELNISY
jgi:hypothetical protein